VPRPNPDLDGVPGRAQAVLKLGSADIVELTRLSDESLGCEIGMRAAACRWDMPISAMDFWMRTASLAFTA
jgi:hypothetical protein